MAKTAQQQHGKKKHQINRRTKVHLIFNEQERKDYLKGFKKRKDQRRQKAKEIFETKFKEEKKRLKEEHRKKFLKLIENQRTVPEVDHLLNPVTYELPNHVVTISTETDIDLAGHDGLRIGTNKITDDASDEEDATEKETDSSKITKSRECRRAFKKSSLKCLQKSKSFKLQTTVKQKKDLQRSRRQNRLKQKWTKKRNRNPKLEK